MKMRFTAFTLFQAAAMVSCLLPSSMKAQAPPAAPIHNIVLVHGAWADGSSWQKIIPTLEEKGFHVVCVQNPLTSFTDDVAATKRLIDAQDGPTVDQAPLIEGLAEGQGARLRDDRLVEIKEGGGPRQGCSRELHGRAPSGRCSHPRVDARAGRADEARVAGARERDARHLREPRPRAAFRSRLAHRHRVITGSRVVRVA